MPRKVNPIPQGYHTVTPSLMVRGAAQALDFYRTAFNAEETLRMPGPDGKIMHAEFRIGDSVMMLGEEMPDMGGKSPQSLGGSPVSFFIYLENVDEAWQRAINAGAKEVMPLADMFWGDRAGCVDDPFGHHWWLAQHVADLTLDEIKKGQEEFFSQRHTTPQTA
ncbi:MAG TPA: VOC family protein [Gemmatimonadales bacterium]|nr:VOC family protein [Gemmatimonadales bacterium]